jgi:hypothetical protein
MARHRLLQVTTTNPTCGDRDGNGVGSAAFPCTGALRPKPGQGAAVIIAGVADDDVTTQGICCEAVGVVHALVYGLYRLIRCVYHPQAPMYTRCWLDTITDIGCALIQGVVVIV